MYATVNRCGDLRLYSTKRNGVRAEPVVASAGSRASESRNHNDKVDAGDRSDLMLLEVVRAAHGPGQMVNCLCVIPGSLVASGGSDWSLQLWSVARGATGDPRGLARAAQLQGHSNEISCICPDAMPIPASAPAGEAPSLTVSADPSPHYIFSGDIGGDVLCWDLRSFRHVKAREALHSSAVTCMRIHETSRSSADDARTASHLYTGGKDGFVKVSARSSSARYEPAPLLLTFRTGFPPSRRSLTSTPFPCCRAFASQTSPRSRRYMSATAAAKATLQVAKVVPRRSRV
jgi:hypothetical protein